ncbi:segment polarity protein dishevelled homolog DVL-3-like [Hydractinia symbiolongicarpus]|uniref:segment polarity protein dishevelled homolog DVL-3-like n=1 Tax=Hydractinia symbiolongicarpus TaxID=13093 RepID=UPI00254DDC73|nr:segment polarity protein dishevelled homolog DVL-3-like [Hydractinia symbiolongicarpus]
MASSSEETKIIYHVDDEETPYLVKIPKPPAQVTLGDFKNVINRPNYKFFFKSMDDDFGVVKEEIIEDDALLPCFNGRVVSWVVPPDEDGASNHSGEGMFNPLPNVSRSSTIRSAKDRNVESDAESIVSRKSSRSRTSRRYESDAERRPRRMHRENRSEFDASSVMSSDLETTSFVDSDEESQMSSATESSRYVGGQRRRRRRRQRMPRVERCSSFSTITESTMSLNIITVTLNMDKINFLGISIVGQANKKGDGGIYVGSVMKGGAVDADGRVEPGDMILAVGDTNFENMSNDDAVRVLRECVHKPGPITLTVAKCWDPTPKGYFAVPKNDVTRPIDPAAWLQHSEAVRASGGLLGRGTGSPSMSTMTSTSDSLTSSIPEADRYLDNPDGLDFGLTIDTDMHTIVKVMASSDSGLVVRDRMWLKITIPNAFIGSDLVDWLFAHVEGFQDRRDARKYASKLLKTGLIRHTVNKITFSEQCYYVFGDLTNRMKGLSIQDIEGSEEDSLAPIASTAPSHIGSWIGQSQGNYIMSAGGVPMIPAQLMGMGPGSDAGGPPSYQQCYPQVYPGYQFFSQHPGSIANSQGVPSHHTGGSGSNHSGSAKSGSLKNSQRDPDQVTIRSSGSSERSHSSKGSKREMNDKSSLASFQLDTVSLRSEAMSEHSVASVRSNSQMVPMGGMVMGMPGAQLPPGGVMLAMPPQPNQMMQAQQQQQQQQASNLESMPSSLTASRQSFRMAMGNSSNEFFVDVM